MDLLEVRATDLAAAPAQRARELNVRAASSDVIEVADPDGLLTYRRADDLRGLRSLRNTIDRSSRVRALGVDVGDVLRTRILAIAKEKALDLAFEELVRRFLIPAVDSLLSKEDGVLRRMRDEAGAELGSAGGPKVLLVHGTFSNPEGSFGDLAADLAGYDARVYAHRTLQRSPIENAIDLCDELIADETWAHGPIRLVAYSRGGLIGDLLARMELPRGRRERAYVADREGSLDRGELRELDRRLDVLRRRMTFEHYVRVATPAAGTSLATERFPRKLEALFNAIGLALKVLPPSWTKTILEATRQIVKTVVLGVVRYGIEADNAPGLGAMHTSSPLVKVLRASEPIATPTHAVGARLRGKWAWSFSRLFAKGAAAAGRAVFQEDHDMVVNSSSMTRGVPRLEEAMHESICSTEITWHLSYFGSAETRPAILGALAGERPSARAAAPPRTRGKAAKKPVLVLFADEAARTRPGVWPDTGELLRWDGGTVPSSSPHGVLERPYAALHEHFDVRTDPRRATKGALWVAHGTGIARLRREHPERSAEAVFLGASSDASAGRRRRTLTATLEEVLAAPAAEKLAGALVPRAQTSGPSPRAWIVGVDEEGAADQLRGDEVGAWLGTSQSVAKALVAMARGELGRAQRVSYRLEPARARPARGVADWELGDALPSAEEWVEAALGSRSLASVGAEAPALLEVGVTHASAPYARAGLYVLFQHRGSALSEVARALELRWGGTRFATRQSRGLLPVPGTATVVRWKSRPPVVMAGLRDAHDVRAGDVRAAVEVALLEAHTEGCTVTDVAVPVLGAEAFDRIGVSEAVDAVVEATLEVRERLVAEGAGLDSLPRRIELLARYEDVAIQAGHAARATASVRLSDGVAFTRVRTDDGRWGRRRLGLDERLHWTRWRITATDDSFHYDIDDGRSVRERFTKERPAPPELGLAGASLDLGVELVPGALRQPGRLEIHRVLELDGTSAAYPWELAAPAGSPPVALRYGLIRQLVDVPRQPGVPEVVEASALVIGDPSGAGGSPLPGAAEEAERVADRLMAHGYRTTVSVGAGASENLAILDGRYGIVHIAAHGFASGGGGVLIGSGRLLTPSIVQALDSTPKLVFLNCCESGALAVGGTEALRQLAGAFMANGTRAFIGAAWPVGDAAAAHFATELYDAMLRGAPLGRAVRAARASTNRSFPGDSTWSAYQVYGDPGLALRTHVASANPPTFVLDREARDELVSIIGDLETLPDDDATRERLLHRLERVGVALDATREGASAGGRYGDRASGAVQERLGAAYVRLGREEEAVRLWRSAMRKRSTRAECLENLADLEARLAFRNDDLATLERAAGQLRAIARLRPTAMVLCMLANAEARLAAMGSGPTKSAHAAFTRSLDLCSERSWLAWNTAAQHVIVLGPYTAKSSRGLLDAVPEGAAMPHALARLALAPRKGFDERAHAKRLDRALGRSLDRLDRQVVVDMLRLAHALRPRARFGRVADLLKAS